MGRTLRTIREGEKELRVDVAAGTTTVATIPNYGHTFLTTADGTDFVLDAPKEGCVKKITVPGFTTTTATIVVRANPTSASLAVKVDLASGTQVTFSGAANNSTAQPQTVEMVGYNSTQWVVTGSYPSNAAQTTVAVTAGTS